MVVIEIGGWIAVCDGYQWRSSEPLIAALLNDRRHPDGPSGADPDPDYTLAQDVVRDLPARILWHRSDPCEESFPNV